MATYTLHPQNRLSTLLGWVVHFTDPGGNPGNLKATEDALLHLAETAPHLLLDIGFVRDPTRSNDTRTVLQSAWGEIEISHPTPSLHNAPAFRA